MTGSSRSQPRLRKYWLNVHLGIALGAGLLLAVMGLTGSILVFHDLIDRALAPDLLSARSDVVASVAPLEELEATLRHSCGPDGAPLMLGVPTGDIEVAQGWCARAAGQAEIYLDPATAAFLGERPLQQGWVQTIYDLHYTLLLGDAGLTIVAILGMLLLVSAVSGLYLWWPRGRWRPALTVPRKARGAQLEMALHRVGGAYVALLLGVVALTGAYMAAPQWFDPVIEGVFSVAPPLDTGTASRDPRAPTISAAQAAAIAQTRFPAAEFVSAWYPADAASAYEIVLRQAGETRWSGGETRIAIDPLDGAVLDVVDPRGAPAGSRILSWVFPLHNGEAFGLAGRLVVLLLGLAPMFLFYTGLRMWLKKRRARRRNRAAKMARWHA